MPLCWRLRQHPCIHPCSLAGAALSQASTRQPGALRWARAASLSSRRQTRTVSKPCAVLSCVPRVVCKVSGRGGPGFARLGGCPHCKPRRMCCLGRIIVQHLCVEREGLVPCRHEFKLQSHGMPCGPCLWWCRGTQGGADCGGAAQPGAQRAAEGPGGAAEQRHAGGHLARRSSGWCAMCIAGSMRGAPVHAEHTGCDLAAAGPCVVPGTSLRQALAVPTCPSMGRS